MQRKMLLGALLVLTFALSTIMKPASAVDTLSPNDFKLESFSKTVDFFDFARHYAAINGKTPPPGNWHAYLYQVYVNVGGFQLFYSGLINITAGGGALTIPVQSFLEHYKTPEGKDVLTSSSFIMLLAFNDTATSKYTNSPDVNDNLYASFSLGLDLTDIYGSSAKPALSSKTTVIPLTSSSDKLTWEWGMRYTNMTAVWWRMFVDPLNPRYEILPIAITTYDELTFTYKLTLDPTNHTAKVTANYVIGRMTNLWLIYWFFLIPIVTHYNSTGAYRLNGTRIPSEPNIYQFLDRQHIKMSIVQFQNSLVLDYTTKSTFNNQNATDSEFDVSNGAIETKAENETASETIFKADFGTKKQYKLYNYTADQTETSYDTYDAVTRTAPRPGYAGNPLFTMHVALLKYVPLIVAYIDPSMYQRAKDRIVEMTYSDYLYITSYPKYSGFRVEHDPTYIAYAAITLPSSELPRLFGIILIGGAAAAAVVGAVYVLKRRGSKTQMTQPPTPPATTTTT